MSFPGEISRLAMELGAAAFAKVCARLESASPGTTAAVALADLDDELAPWASAALRTIVASESRPDVLAITLRCAAAAASATRESIGDSDLVWSGPDAGVTAMHSLEQALRDLILGAERELWLVSFAAFRVPHLLTALRQTAQRGVRLHFLLETSGDNEGQLSVDARAAFAGGLSQRASFYAWPLENRPRTRLHRQRSRWRTGRSHVHPFCED